MVPRIRKVIDCSMSLYHAQPRYVDNPILKITPHSGFWRAGTMYGGETEEVEMNTHVGTHLDLPYHAVEGGRRIGDMPPEEFMGEAIVIDASQRQDKLYIQVSDLKPRYENKIKKGDIILFYTGWAAKRAYSTEWLKDYPNLTTDCSKWIMKYKPKGVGFDFISIDSFHGPKTTTKEGLKPAPEGETNHRILIAGDIWGVEEMNLPKEALQKERWWFSALPLRFDEAGGSPTRAVLIDFE
jgi:arylformamidase